MIKGLMDFESAKFARTLPLTEEHVWTVSEATSRIKSLIESQPDLLDISIRGEVTNLSRSKAGHIYFSLKDNRCLIKCVAFRGSVSRLRAQPEDGREVVAHGQITVYEAGGTYQLIIDALDDVGLGALWLKFEELRRKLSEEGLFDEAVKRSLPSYPRAIGLVTSSDGAALRDMLRILSERAPYAQVVLSPSLVQGETAPVSLIRALDLLEMWSEMEKAAGRPGVDLIIIGRGGGSFEDLSCFNDESLARRIRSCKVPIISAVGHEVDFTIADFVADIRAATPTQAAVIAAPAATDLVASIESFLAEYRQAAEIRIETYRTGLDNVLSRPVFRKPMERMNMRRQDIDVMLSRLARAIGSRTTLIRHRLDSLANRLQALDPSAILSRGYSLAFESESGKLISRVEQARSGTKVDLRVSDGTIKLTAD
jgi:exodeoxyribonuclease VII large subunit